MCSCSGGVKITRDNLDYYEKLWKRMRQWLQSDAEGAEEPVADKDPEKWREKAPVTGA